MLCLLIHVFLGWFHCVWCLLYGVWIHFCGQRFFVCFFCLYIHCFLFVGHRCYWIILLIGLIFSDICWKFLFCNKIFCMYFFCCCVSLYIAVSIVCFCQTGFIYMLHVGHIYVWCFFVFYVLLAGGCFCGWCFLICPWCTWFYLPT